MSKKLQESKANLMRDQKKMQMRINILNSSLYTFIILLFSMYVIFSDSFKRSLTDEKHDTLFDIFTIVAILFFIFDLFLVASVKNKSFLTSFLLFSEMICTISLIFDLSFFYIHFFSTSQSKDFEEYSYLAG